MLKFFNNLLNRNTDATKEPAPLKQESSATLTNDDRFAKEHAILEYVLNTATKGDPDSVLKAIDDYGYNVDRHISLGDVKGNACCTELLKRKPNPMLIVELGLYIGYSSILFAKLLPPGGLLISFEVEPEFIKIASTLIEFAGLKDRHLVICGAFSQKWEELKKFVSDERKVD
ncbi:hypothetical protein HDU76_008094, partial [Blyttiomyces sp. JEL0837]